MTDPILVPTTSEPRRMMRLTTGRGCRPFMAGLSPEHASTHDRARVPPTSLD